MNKLILGFLGLVCTATWALAPGEMAPDFTLKDSHGTVRHLGDSKGKWVVLEWLNHGCPYVQKMYGSKKMQELQTKYTGEGVVWFSVISSAKGKQGYSTAQQANQDVKDKGAHPTAVLFDSDGAVGKKYGAQTTPHMYVIDPAGKLAYLGAIDDKRSTQISDVAKAHNYVAAALDAGRAGKPIAKAATEPYGCGVKY